MTEHYIKTESLSEPCRRLADDINRAYAAGYFVCTALLLRSMLEIMVTDVLLRNPGPAAVWEDSKKGLRYGLHRLLTTFWDLAFDDYKPYLAGYSGESLGRFKDVSWEIKKLGDSCAHEILPNEIERKLTELESDLGNLVILFTHLRSRVPEGRRIPSDNRSEKTREFLRYEIGYPDELPSKTYWLKHRDHVSYFDITFRVQPTPTETTCDIEVESDTQAVCFLLENPVKRMDWRTLRREEHILVLNQVISDRLSFTNPTEYVFHALFRPSRLHSLQKQVTLKYRVNGRKVDGKGVFDTGHTRLVLSLVDNAPSKPQQNQV